MTIKPSAQTNLLGLMQETMDIGCRAGLRSMESMLDKMTFRDSPVRINVDAENLLINFEQAEVLGIRFDVSGLFDGIVGLFMTPVAIAATLVKTGQGEPTQTLSDLQVSTLLEVGNIFVSSFLNALSAAYQKKLMPSTPSIVRGAPISLLLKEIQNAGNLAPILCAEKHLFDQHDRSLGFVAMVIQEKTLSGLKHSLT
ncbi:MAG: chemotaxis protein CheC [Myxococcota bacterium]